MKCFSDLAARSIRGNAGKLLWSLFSGYTGFSWVSTATENGALLTFPAVNIINRCNVE
ncbi:MAG: hypothetical protein C5S49_05605 [Candidatus Methanogaster sp.]|nr:MAG: hypothetical protein C5S49_05605 [ANME-2 cluster archaeon]